MSCDWQELNRRLNIEKLNIYLIETALAEVVFFAKGYIIQAAFISLNVEAFLYNI